MEKSEFQEKTGPPGTGPPGSFWEVLRVFTKLGLTSFGGPTAHLGFYREEIVRRRGWVDERAYADLVGLCQSLPGPASSQVGFALGLARAGIPGGFAAWLGFKIEKRYADGISWGQMKQVLFEYLNEHMKPAREEYERLIADPAIVEAELQKGAAKAREIAAPYMQQIRSAIGIRKLG